MAPRFKKPMTTSAPAPVDPWSIQQLYSRDGQGLPAMSDLQNYAKGLTADQRAAAKAKANQPKQPKMDWLDKASAKFYDVTKAVGGAVVGGIKQDVNALRENPLGSINKTLDEYTLGQESRNRLRQGDITGAINQSGVGQFAALPELENIFRGKGSKSDLAWLAATYGTGGLGKGFKLGKDALKKGSTKAYIDILNRLK